MLMSFLSSENSIVSLGGKVKIDNSGVADGYFKRFGFIVGAVAGVKSIGIFFRLRQLT